MAKFPDIKDALSALAVPLAAYGIKYVDSYLQSVITESWLRHSVLVLALIGFYLAFRYGVGMVVT